MKISRIEIKQETLKQVYTCRSFILFPRFVFTLMFWLENVRNITDIGAMIVIHRIRTGSL